MEFRNVQNAIFLPILIIVLSFISYLFVDEFNNTKNITLGYYVGILFILYIFSVFPFFKEIIGKSSQIKQVLEEVHTLSLEDFKQVSRYRYQNKNTESKLGKLKKVIDSFIIENKIESYEVINDKILEKGLEIIGEGDDRQKCDDVLGAITWLWGENCRTAIRVNDSHFFDSVWNSINSIYQRFADKKIELLHIQEVESFIYFDLKTLYKYFKNTISLGNALDVIENSFNENITKNCPNQEEIWGLMNFYEKVDDKHSSYLNSSLSWEGIKNIINKVFDIQDIAIELGDKELFKECNQRINLICSHIIYDFNNLGKYQKGYLTWQTLKNYYYSSIALEKGLYKDTLDCYKVHKHLIERIIEKESLKEEDIRVILKNLGNYLFEALKNKKLHSNYDFGTFPDFCRIGIHSIKKYNESGLNKNIVDYFINYLKHLKSFVENDGIENYPNEYNNVKRAIAHFINVAITYDGMREDENRVKEWKEILNDFKEISKETPLNIDWEIK
ncbi:hypothetical protein D1000_05365 [Riemerella anatipestifer]|uniref:hypothetical protein n=2 Tax=Riemerella anatipestifer TaxID=34085 RepID=UPI00129D9355|nr:hypothetical protein [Riemerella anatipestifer]MRN16255.1 hypothetical protein [Riemerella anatipestifer]